MDDTDVIEINLGKYLEVLIRQWQLIAGLTAVFVAVTAAITFLQPKTYEARAMVATTKLASTVSFESGIETLSEEQLGYRPGGSAPRLQSYVLMVKNPVIAQRVIEALGNELPEDERDPLVLMGKVNGNVASNSDSIEIKVTHRDSRLATLIANAWGEAYVEHVNSVYSGIGLSESYTAIQRQTAEARTAYEQTQAELEEFVASSQKRALDRRIKEQEALINGLVAARGLATSTIISDTTTAKLSVIDEQVLHLQEDLAETYEESRQISQWLMAAEDMRYQIEHGGSGATSSNSLALILLKAQIFASEDGSSSNLEIQASPVSLTAEEMAVDLDGLIVTLKARQISLDTEIQTLSQQLMDLGAIQTPLSLNAGEGGALTAGEWQATMQALLEMRGLEESLQLGWSDTPLEKKILNLEEQLIDLQSQYEHEVAREQELSRARDLAWQTYATLATKEEELKVAAQAAGTEVTFAVPAVLQGATLNPIRNVAMAGVVGLVLGVFIAYLLEFWWNYRGVEPVPISVFHRAPRAKP